jgi:hypothetical protein
MRLAIVGSRSLDGHLNTHVLRAVLVAYQAHNALLVIAKTIATTEVQP